MAQAYTQFLIDHESGFGALISKKLKQTEVKYEKKAGVGKRPDLYSFVKDHWVELHANVQSVLTIPDDIALHLPAPASLVEEDE